DQRDPVARAVRVEPLPGARLGRLRDARHRRRFGFPSSGLSHAGHPTRPADEVPSLAVFVLLLTYVRPLPEVDALMREHVGWLKEHYAAGRFVVSGRRIPRTGGVILARGDDRAEIEALAATDPFVRAGVATCEVVPVRAAPTGPGVEAPGWGA